MGESRDGAIASLTGESKQKRLIAAQLVVDPYTDLQPLASKLDSLAGAAAIGNLAVSDALTAVPGAAGAVASNASTASTLPGMVNDYSAAQLMDMNREKLDRLGVSGAIADQLFANSNYTPLDVAAMVEALTGLGGAKSLDAMVARAASADSREAAYFVRRRIELTGAYQRQSRNIAAFIGTNDLEYRLCLTAGGGIVGVFPIDSLPWTLGTARTFETMTAETRQNGAAGTKTLIITGVATPWARQKLAALSWTLRTNDRLQ